MSAAQDLFTAIRGILSVGWDFLISVDVPGLGIPFAYLFIGIFLAVLGIRILGWALGLVVTAGRADVGGVQSEGFIDRSLGRLPGRK